VFYYHCLLLSLLLLLLLLLLVVIIIHTYYVIKLYCTYINNAARRRRRTTTQNRRRWRRRYACDRWLVSNGSCDMAWCWIGRAYVWVYDDDYNDVVCAYVYKTRGGGGGGGDGCEEAHINLHAYPALYYFIINIINIMIKYYIFTIPAAHDTDEKNIFLIL